MRSRPVLTRRRVRWALAALVVVLAVDVTGRSFLSWREASAAYQDLQRVQQVLRPLAAFEGGTWPGREEYQEAVPAAERASNRLQSARDRLWFRGLLADGPGRLPWIGTEIRDGVVLLEGGTTLAEAASQLLTTAEPLFQPGAPLISATREVVVVRAAEVRAAFDLMEAASTRLKSVQPDGWGFPLTGYAAQVREVQTLLAHAVDVRPTFEVAAAEFDALLGYDGPVTYLLAGQNDQELRPTGGYIGSMGLLTLEDGEIVEREYASSIEFSPATPPTRAVPEELTLFLGAGHWYVRDANWWPDFPTSAQAILRLLEEDAGARPDGVIAVDSRFVGAMIGLFEPVTVAGFPEPITRENWFDLAEEAITGGSGNPTAASGEITGWRTSGANSLEAVNFDDVGIPTDGLPDGVRTGVRATYQDIDQLLVYAFQLQSDAEYRGSFYIWVPPGWVGGPPSVDFSEFQDMQGGALVHADPALYGRWQRVETVGTPSTDAQGNLRVYLLDPPPPGSALYVTYAEVVASDPEVATAEAVRDQSAKQAYLQPVLDTVIGSLQSAGVERLGQIAQAIRVSSDGRHFQAYLRDEGAQQLIEAFGADGRLQPEPGVELLAVVDANLSYSKIQPAIERDVTVLLGERGERDVIVRWRNFLPELGEVRTGRLGQGGLLFDYATLEYEPVDGVFGTYMRVYAPIGSRLLLADGFDSPPRLTIEGGFTVIGGWVIVRSGEERQVVVSYAPPESQPMLRVWKQGGIESYGLRVVRNSEGAQEILFDGDAVADVTIGLE